MNKTIDARGLVCPQPVILAKKEWNETHQTFSILVDNHIAVQNLQKLAQSLQVEIKIQVNRETTAPNQGTDEIYEITFVNAKTETPSSNVSRETNATSSSPTEIEIETPATLPSPLKPFTLFVGKDHIGEGEKELGEQLITMYFYTLTQSENIPRTIAFMNRGVFLPTRNEQVVEHLKTLQQKGCQILVCGACLNFYQLKDELKVGEISNMYDIWTKLSEYHSIVSL